MLISAANLFIDIDHKGSHGMRLKCTVMAAYYSIYPSPRILILIASPLNLSFQ